MMELSALTSPRLTDPLARLQAALPDRYTIERDLGRGGMATVYLAQDRKHHRLVAIKVLKPEIAATLGPERFLREIEVAARLAHPHILPMHDSGEAGGFLYYVMPFVEGDSLRARLAREVQLPVRDVIQILREIADALAYAHRHGVVHRDIKPDNLMLTSRHALVMDFGVAKAVSAATGALTLTTDGLSIGTPAYMAPEQAAGDSHVDHRADIYALGMVGYEMLTGRPPFTAATPQAILAAQVTEDPEPVAQLRPSVPPLLAQIIMKCLRKKPADRWQSAEEVLQQLEPLATPSEAVPVEAAVPRRGWPLRRPLAFGATAAIGIVGVVGAALLARRNGARDTGAASRVVVMPFENRTADAELDPLGTMVAEWLTQGLTEAPFLTVLDTRGAQAAARKLGAAAVPVAVGRETGAGVVVAGSYFLQGDSLQFQAQISSTADGSILLGVGGVAAPRDRPLEAVEQLRQRALAGLASLNDKEVTAFQTTLTQPPTYAAYREYTEGLELYIRNESEDARHFERAAVLDSSFLAARLWAVQAWLPPRPGNLVAVDSLLDGLQPLRHRLSPFHRAQLDFVVALRARDFRDAYRAALRRLETAPGSMDARREVALSALRVLRPREALARLGELDPEGGLIRQWPEYWSPIAWSHHILGEYDRELAAARRGRALNPSSGHFRFLELRALAALGRTVELDSLVRAELSVVSGQSGILARTIAGELLAHGHAEAARRLARYAADLLAVGPPPEHASQEWFQQRASVAVFSGETEVWDYFPLEHSKAHSPSERAKDEWLHERAELALLLGDVHAAGNFAAQLVDQDAHGLLLARVGAVQGRHEAARAALERAEVRYLDRWGSLRGLELDRASALVRLGDMESALAALAEGLNRGLIFDGVWGNDGHARPDLAPLWPDPRFQALIKPRG